ncbi:unnamed protein product [Polarella glacialis]|uniref:C2 domain-containing protein n=1 Tax=Polarella glacialis TaxID=89957 RepID=A0A813FNR0_POLGL|nr:unnamed protein product [Polarella glacialis]
MGSGCSTPRGWHKQEDDEKKPRVKITFPDPVEDAPRKPRASLCEGGGEAGVAAGAVGAGGGLAIKIENCTHVPDTDLTGHSDAYVVVKALVDGKEIATVFSSVRDNSRFPVWNEWLVVPGDVAAWSLSNTEIKFELWDEDLLVNDYIGEAVISLQELVRRSRRELLLTTDGDAVLSSEVPRKPCQLRVSLEVESMPQTWPRPVPRETEGSYPKHIFMMSRGTRGDVQPFVALARGMAEQLGWLVTICTEIRWKPFIHSNSRCLTKGKIRFLPSGGDTAVRIERWEAKWAMESKSEIVQCAMLAFSEAEFFSSGPVFVHHVEELKQTTPIDLIVSAFTLTGLAMMVSECCAVPMAGFVLQPSCIPSSDPTWKCVVEIKKDNRFSVTNALESSCTSHKTLAKLKGLAEDNPFSSFGITSLRREFGLKLAQTWQTIFRLNIPMVIPMAPGTFTSPSDWGSRVVLTDFIFLRGGGGTDQGSLSPEIADFIRNARAAGRKLAVMSFSSMPVARKKMLQSAVKMLMESVLTVALIYVGKRFDDVIPADLAGKTESLKSDGRFLEVEGADFGALFKEMDCFIIHGGLGTTVEALRTHKPVAVTGLLLMDQRFWGGVCALKGVGPNPVHIDEFPTVCVDFLNDALTDQSEYVEKAQLLTWGDEESDGVSVNVQAFATLLDEGVLPVEVS